jgi:hypothetical protein
MVRGFYAQITAALRDAGFEYKRQAKGDHEVWYNAKLNKSVIVDRGSLSRHTANGVMKQAGLTKRF